MKMKKRITATVIILLLALAAALFVAHLIINKPYSWKPLKETDRFRPLFEEEIKEIKLIDVIDMAVWAEFDDEDLVEKWKDYLGTLEIKEFFSLLPASCSTGGSSPINDGGTGNVIIKTEKAEYRLFFSHGAAFMSFNDKYYDIKSETPFPYRETYDEAAARHGEKTPWE